MESKIKGDSIWSVYTLRASGVVAFNRGER